MSSTELWRLSASEIATRTSAGDISAEQATASAVARMEAVNPALNAVIESLADEAAERARDLDLARADGRPLGRLHGVPVTIKVNVDQTGHATTNGVVALKDLIAPANAPIVDNLLAEGAVVIGRTNTPEFSFRADTDNPLYGRTHNPWGDHVSPGGSSGGAGSAVMAGIGALGHGNDIGGSLRFPAAANGAVTVKPGLGRVPAWNPSQTAERGMLAQSMSVQGILAREARDLHVSMPAAIAPDPRDPFHVPLPWRGDALEGPVKVAFTKDTCGFDLHPEVSAALDAARDALADAGYDIEEIEPPYLQEAGSVGYRTLMGEVRELMGPAIQDQGSDTIRAIFDEYFDQFAPFEGKELLAMMAKRSFYAREWSLFLQRYPDGALSAEAGVLQIEAVAATDADRAVKLADLWLGTQPDHGRRVDVLTLRATLARDRLEDCRRALPSYRELARIATGGAQARALAYQGICAAQVGDAAQAAPALDAALSHSSLPRALAPRVRAARDRLREDSP